MGRLLGLGREPGPDSAFVLLSPGEFAFQLIAYDLDGDPITYKISGTDSFYFNADEQTGVVTLKNLLDREVRAGTD